MPPDRTSALLVVLTIVQVMLPSLQFSLPFVATLYVVNALALLGVSAAMARQGRAEARARHKRLKHPVA
jgi:hypothetical protein